MERSVPRWIARHQRIGGLTGQIIDALKSRWRSSALSPQSSPEKIRAAFGVSKSVQAGRRRALPRPPHEIEPGGIRLAARG
jgi:hypothetical protein